MRQHYLYEGLFDDDELFSTDDGTEEIGEILIQNEIDEILKLLAKPFFENGSFWNSKPTEKKLYAKYDKDSICFYYNTADGVKYVSQILIHSNNSEHFNDIQNIINKLSTLGITYVFTDLCLRNYTDIKTIDLKDIQFLSYIFYGMNINNMVVDFDSKENHEYMKYYLTSTYKTTTDIYMSISLVNCQLNDNILINRANTINLEYVSNINDFSFIKKINDGLHIQYSGITTLPKCNSLKGIPDGDYKLHVEYKIPSNKNDTYENINLQTLEGIHNNLNKIQVDIYEYPIKFLQHFSFKGLTLDILPKFEFNAYRFPGKSTVGYYVQLGPYLLTVNSRKWHPTKPQYQTIINTQNWFLDCYKETPHKEYIEPEYEDEKDIKQMKKVEKFNQKIEDAKEDLNKMVQNLKGILKNNAMYYGSVWSLKITGLADKQLSYIIYQRWSANRKYETYEGFIKKELLNDSRHWHIDKNKTILLKDLVCTPVQEERQKILKKRKKQEQIQKEKEKLLKAETKKQEKLNKKSELQQETQPVQKDVEIIDYSDKAIAVIGNTYPIKDQLKELGAKFNKSLTVNGQRTAGWILSKRKKADVEQII